MALLTRDPCDCTHARREHDPEGCTACECELCAPNVFRRSDGSEYEGWRPPFEPGHELTVRHGATSPRLVSERASAVLGELRREFWWLGDADGIAVDALCRALAVFDPLDRYVLDVIEGRVPAYPRKGAPRTGVEAVPPHVYEQWSRTHKAILETVGKLGMTPADRARLFKDTGWAKKLALEACSDQLEPLRAAGRALRLKQREESRSGL